MNRTDFYLDEYGFSQETDFCEWCIGQAVQALIDDGKEETAALLLACRVSWEWENWSDGKMGISATLHGPMNAIRAIQEVELYDMDDRGCPNLDAILEVLQLVLGPKLFIERSGFQVESSNLPANWREELLEIARKKGTTNQGRTFSTEKSTLYQYANLHFRSQSEIRIAKSLDKQAVMYFANCTARVNKGIDRVNREPDFLVCYNKRWGILEVDGEPFHTPTNAAQDHDRDRIFEHHGVRFVQHYNANRCYQEPDQVVTEFLELLAKNG